MRVHLTGPSLDFFAEMDSSFLFKLFFSIRVATVPWNVLEVGAAASASHAGASLPKMSSSVIVSVSVLHFFIRGSERARKVAMGLDY